MNLKFAAVLCFFISLPQAHILHNDLPAGSNFGIPGEDASYDFVVIGGGTAGLPLATRLAQDGKYSVAIIEAGSFYEIDNGNRSVIPGYSFYSSGFTSLEGVNAKIDWSLMIEPQVGANNKVAHYPRGKCLGGSSARNYLVYQRPTRGTMEEWARRVGDESWSWENVLPYYKKSATLNPPDMKTRAANATPMYDSKVFDNGPLQVSYPKYSSPFAPWVARAFEQGGLPLRNSGMQSGDLIGFGFLPLTSEADSQERSSSQTSYGNLALRSTGLQFYIRTFAKRILFTGKRATGVRVETDHVAYTISARREVILSAGVFQSPQLLMVSGIGPAETLRKYKIPVVEDLPGVGQNMEDNPLFGISFPVNVETALTYMGSFEKMTRAINEYNERRSGFLTTSGADVIAFQKLSQDPSANLSDTVKADLAWLPDDFPDAMFWSFALWLGPALGSPPPDARVYGSIIGSITAPMSRGYVTIESSDMADRPIINPNWMTHSTDEEMAVAVMRRIREFVKSEALQAISTGDEAWPGPEVTSYDDLLAAVKQQLATYSHASCTCKMGQSSDPMAVVDSKARVFGIQNLRVVDISAMPFLPPGQPQATVYMLGEKIADDILKGDTAWMLEQGTAGHDEL